jgi:hypothetical protein
MSQMNKLQRVELLLSSDLEISEYTRAVSMQQLGKHVTAVTDTHVTIEVLLEVVSSTRFVPRSYKEDKWGNRVFSVRMCVRGRPSRPLHRDLSGLLCFFCTDVCKENNSVGTKRPFREKLSPEAQE